MPTSIAISPLGPIDPASLQASEEEKHAPWIVRKLVGVRAPPRPPAVRG
jgi:hypothetical protein